MTQQTSYQIGGIEDSEIVFTSMENILLTADLWLFEWEKLSITVSHEETTPRNELFRHFNMRLLYLLWLAAMSEAAE